VIRAIIFLGRVVPKVKSRRGRGRLSRFASVVNGGDRLKFFIFTRLRRPTRRIPAACHYSGAADLIAETNKHVNPVDATSGRSRACAMAGWSTKYHGKSAAYSPCGGERSAGLESPIFGPVTDLVKGLCPLAMPNLPRPPGQPLRTDARPATPKLPIRHVACLTTLPLDFNCAANAADYVYLGCGVMRLAG
jgi:hypothetical protein